MTDFLALSEEFESTHKTWHKFSDWLVRTYGKDLHGEWKTVGEGDKKLKYRSFDDLELSRRLVGYDVIDRVERYVRRYCPKIRVLRCDDDYHAGATILLIPHPRMGISVMFIPQCTSIQNRFFLYEGHYVELLKALNDLRDVYPPDELADAEKESEK